MPIAGDQRDLYGLDWAELSWNIVVHRAGGRCECTGHCGGIHAHLEPVDGRCRNRHGQARWRGKPGQRPVILSAAHLDHDPEARDLDRILVMCEACHLRHDAAWHWATRRRGFEQATGTLPLFELA
ncbi:MAG TPA: hypothetical protein VFE65_19950 [Pseudonocardia sp.]|jgi:hypothetical protein|nr:hypothetical protein [Pseudonocardia sp.]